MRTIFLLIFLCCAGLIAYAQYLQHVVDLLPCPLCVAQRVAYWILGLIALLAFLHNPKTIGQRLYGGLLLIFASAGAVVAFRQSWLIRYPESFECGISPEEEFLNTLPIAEWWPGMFEANGDCADVEWEFLSLAIPDWSFIAFVGLGLLATSAFIVKKNEDI
ncbi:MAG: disulfide bond formation protein B [Nitrosomonas sp.]|nr:disulfide bond formation protein B [Nitrosomonas sp.]